MMIWGISVLAIIMLLFIFLASYLDLKYRAIPSVILTAGIFIVFMLRPENLYFGIGALIFAILIQDLINDMSGLEFGVADIKVFVIIGLMISTLSNFLLMIGIFLVFQFIYTLLYHSMRTHYFVGEDINEMPFIPCLYAVYIAMVLLGGIT